MRQAIARMRPLVKIICSIAAAAVAGGVLAAQHSPTELALVITWNVFALVALTLTWITIFTLQPKQIHELAQAEDPGRGASLALVLLGAGAALLAVLVLLNASADMRGAERMRAIGVALSAVALAWLLIHTVFTLRYAHVYHQAPDGARPIDFPGLEGMPDYLDFAYFAFVIGMTAQTADLDIRGRRIRRFALLHGLIAFVYNTAVVAMSIGLVSTLLSGN